MRGVAGSQDTGDNKFKQRDRKKSNKSGNAPSDGSQTTDSGKVRWSREGWERRLRQQHIVFACITNNLPLVVSLIAASFISPSLMVSSLPTFPPTPPSFDTRGVK